MTAEIGSLQQNYYF